MRLAMPLDYAGDPNDAARRAVELEHAGLDVVWVAEAYGFDAPSLMGFLAHATERIEIGAGILPIYTRTPALLAQTAAGIDALSGGRCILGLGASGPQVVEGWHGVPYDQPIARTREIIDICRMAWTPGARRPRRRRLHDPAAARAGHGAGQAVEDDHQARAGAHPDLRGVARPGQRRDDGRGGRRLAAAVLHPRAGRQGVGRGAGSRAAPSGRPTWARWRSSPAGCWRSATTPSATGTCMRPMVALYVGGMGAAGRNFYNDLARRYGWEAEAAEIQDLYLDGKKDEAAAAVPAELLEGVSLCGSEGYVRDRLAAMADAGVTVLNVTPVGGDPVRTVELLKSWL